MAAGFNAPPFPVPAQRSRRMVPGAIGRLRPGLSIAQAQARLNSFSAQLSRQYPTDYPAPAGWGLRLVSLQEDLVGSMRTELFVLFGAVGFVLLIACVNLANLLLARSAGRQREIAVRRALGADRGRLIGQLLAENLLLSLISGGAAICALAVMKASLLRLAPADLPRLDEIGLSLGVLLFAFLISILTGVVFGLLPALHDRTSEPDRQPPGGQPWFGIKQTSEKHLAHPRCGGNRAVPRASHRGWPTLAKLLASAGSASRLRTTSNHNCKNMAAFPE